MEKSVLRDTIVLGLKNQAWGEIAKAKANIEIYLANPAGIGEHSDVLAAIQEQIDIIATNQERLDVIENQITLRL